MNMTKDHAFAIMAITGRMVRAQKDDNPQGVDETAFGLANYLDCLVHSDHYEEKKEWFEQMTEWGCRNRPNEEAAANQPEGKAS